MKRQKDQQKEPGIPVSLFTPNPFSFDGCVLVTAETINAAVSQGETSAGSLSFNVSDVTSASNARGFDASDKSQSAGSRQGGSSPAEKPLPPTDASAAVPSGRGLTCGLCKEAFAGVAEQRGHFKSDWHKFNV